MNCDQGSYAESPTLYAVYVGRAAVSDRKLCCGSGAVAPSEWRCRIWVQLGSGEPFAESPLYPDERTSSDRADWSVLLPPELLSSARLSHQNKTAATWTAELRE